MVPYTYNMVDMEGIDLADVKDKTFPGLFDKIVESLNACGVVILYNWYCAWLPIPPQHVDVVVVEDVSVTINGMIIVKSDDTIEIPTMGGSPVLEHLLVEENGTYEPSEGVDGFDLVEVDVSSYTPVIESISIIENGTYNVPSGVDGYNPVIVSVPQISGETFLIIPIMTSNSAPYGTAASSSQLGSQFAPYLAFNGIQVSSNMQGGWLASASDLEPYISYSLSSSKHFSHIVIYTANNSTTTSRIVYIEGYNGSSWENCIANAEYVELEFVNGTYGLTCTEYKISLNNEQYSAIRIRGTEPFYGGQHQYACTFSSIFLYGY